MFYKATKQKVANRGVPPDSFLNELVAWGKKAPYEIFIQSDKNGFNTNKDKDIYTLVFKELGPYEAGTNRRAVMLEVMRVLAGFESSWNWNAGRDITNSTSITATTIEAGAWQVSANSMGFGEELKKLVFSKVGKTDGESFQKAMKENHELAMEYIARLLRRTPRHNGPVKRGEINKYLKKDAVQEFQSLLNSNF